MHTLPYQNTLVDIHTDEDQPAAWAALARFYSYYGARYAPDELRAAYLAEVGRQTAGREGLRRDSHEAHPEIELAGNDPVCDAAGAREAGLDVLYVHSNLSPAGPLPDLDVLYVHSNLSPAGPLPEATFVLPEMDIPRMGAILAGEVQPA